MIIRDLRFVTAIAVMALSAFAIGHGANVVLFRISTASASGNATPSALQSWYAAPGVGDLARQAALPLNLDVASKDALLMQRDALADYLAVRPGASLQWLMLAAARLLLGDPTENVIAAYGLSVVMGPNENDVIVERSKFGLYLWDKLPAELKKREVDDLRLGFFSGEEKVNLRKLFAAMNAQSRDDILKALPKLRIAALGLEP